MPFLTIKDSKTTSPLQFFYLDSGAPDRSVYTTLVVIHGLGFHSAVFQKVLPLATSKGFRMLCLNRRDYPGTTPYSPAELQALSEGDEHSLRTTGVELALFLDAIIDTLSLPGPTVDGTDGGLGIMGWSLGNLITLSTVASIPFFPSQVKTRLQSFLRKLILFDPPTSALGLPSSSRLYSPIFYETITEEERVREIVRWVSSYFAHGDLSTRNVDNIEFKFPNLAKKSIAASLSSEEIDSLVDSKAAMGSDMLFLSAFKVLLLNQTRRALFDPKTRSLWPNLDIWHLYCDSSVGEVIHCALEVKQLAETNESQAIQILTIEDAHHLVFWDEPEKAMKAFEHCLRH